MAEAIAAGATWLANTAAAAATAAGASAATAATIGSVVYGVSYIALSAGVGYAIDSVSRPKLKPPGSELQFNIDPNFPREMIIGQRMVGGSMVARYSRGSNLYNAHLVIQLADHPCVELSKVYDGGRVVRDTPLTHATRTEITAYSNSGGARVWMTWWDGRAGQTADSNLVTNSALDPEVVAGKIEGWTTNHKGAGCAYVHVEVQWDSDILTSIPQFQWLVKGAKLYDRRKDTTAGGSGSHRLNTPSTWEYETNAAVALDHFLLGYQVENDPLAFGIGLSKSEVPYAQFAAAADLCDEDIVTGVSPNQETIKRYAANAVISAGDYFEEVIEAFQVQMAARVVDLGGRIGILGAEERAITVSLTEDDLVADEPLQFADKLQFSDLFGTVTGTYSDPGNNYQPTPYEPLTSAFVALPDGGEAQATTLDLPYETHPRRALRLATAWLERESLQPRLAGVFMPVAWKLEPGDWFEFTSTRLQITAAKFEVIDVVKNDDFTVSITARSIDPAFVAFDVANDPALSVPPEVAPPSTFLDTPTFTVAASTLTAGIFVEPAIQFTLTSTDGVTREIIVEYGKWDGSAVESSTLADAFHVSQTVMKLRKGLLPSTAYKVRAKAKAGERESQWSAWSSVVTLGASSGTSNTEVPAGSNGLVDTTFLFQSTYWAKDSQTGSTAFSVSVSTGGLRKSVITGTGITVGSGNYVRQLSTPQQTAFLCKAGDVIGARILAGGTNISQLQFLIAFRDAAGAAVGFTTVAGAALVSSGILTGAGEETDFNELWVVGTAPSGTVFATIDIRAIASTSAPVLRVAEPLMARLPAGQTVVPLFHPGRDHELGANVTESRTAAAIISQGTLATVSRANVVALSGSETLNNALVAAGANGLVDTAFRFQSTYWTKTSQSGTTTFSVSVSTGGLRKSVNTGAGLTVGHTIDQASNLQQTSFQCKAGDVVGGRVLIAGDNLSAVQMLIAFRDAAGTALAFSTLVQVTSGILTGAGEETDFHELTQVATAPSGTVFATLLCRGIASTSAPVLRIAKPLLARLPSGQTVAPVFSPGRDHELGANVTESRTAAAIVSQGSLATISRANVVSLTGSEALNNALVPVGSNGLVDTGFRFQTAYWTKTQVSGSTTWSASETTEGLRVGVLTGSGVTVNGTDYILGGSQLQRTSFPCKAGDTVGARVLVGSSNASSLQLRIMFRNAAGTLINSALVALSSGLLAGTGDETTFNEMTTSGVAGAGALTVNFEVRAIASTSAPVLRLAKPMLTQMPTGQTAIPAYAPGREHEIGANVTESRTAAAITGQGNQATASMTRGNTASRPATPADWSMHANTETNKLQLYTSGTGWVDVASLNELLTVTRSNSFVKLKIGDGVNTTNSCAFTGAGGSGSGYTFAHALYIDSTTGPTATLSSSSSSPITVSATGVVGDAVVGFVLTTVTDSLGNTAALRSPVALTWEL